MPGQAGRHAVAVPGVLVQEAAAGARVPEAADAAVTRPPAAALGHRGRVARLHDPPGRRAAPGEALHRVGDGRPQRVGALGRDAHRL